LAPALIAGLVFCGSCLLFARLGEIAVWGDEIHSLEVARLGTGSWATSLGGYAPLALYNALLTHTFGLDEWTLRIPAAAAGAAFLAFAGAVAARALPSVQAIILTGLLAFSPYLVHLFRQARPYSMILLGFWLAAYLVVRWIEKPRPGRLAAAALLAACDGYLNTAVLPSLLCLGVLPVWAAKRSGVLRERLPQLAAAAVLFAGAILALFYTFEEGAIRALSDAQRLGGASQADAETLLGTAMLLLGTSSPVAVAASGMVFALGAVRAWRANPRLTGWFLATLGVQVGALLVARPGTSQVPFVFLRYCAHLSPGLFAVLAYGVSPPSRWIGGPKTPRWAAPLVALALVAMLAAANGGAGRYPVAGDAPAAAHPLLLFAPTSRESPLLRALVPRFYTEVLPDWSPGPLVEVPLLPTFPVYELYQRVHGREVYVASVPSQFYGLFASGPGIHFRRSLPFDESAFADTPARFLVLHKHLPAEIRAIERAFLKDPALGRQVRGLRRVLHPWSSRRFVPPGSIRSIRDDLTLPLVYEDASVSVYRLPES
jgi:hypothetical protein